MASLNHNRNDASGRSNQRREIEELKKQIADLQKENEDLKKEVARYYPSLTATECDRVELMDYKCR